MKGYNGVAMFSRIPLARDDGAPDWCIKGDCRHLAVTLDLPGGPIELHDFYVPAGGDIPDREQNPKYGHKLDFVAEATRVVRRAAAASAAPCWSATSTSRRWSTMSGATSSCSTWSATRRRRPRA